MARRILELNQADVGIALREYVQKHHPEQWRAGKLDVVVWKDGMSTLTISWTIAATHDAASDGGEESR